LDELQVQKAQLQTMQVQVLLQGQFFMVWIS